MRVPAHGLHEGSPVKTVADVVLIGPVAPPPGGVASSIAALAAALSRRGADVTVVDPRDRARLVATLLRASAKRAVVHLHLCGHNRRSFYLLALTRLLAGLSPSVVTLHSGILPRYVGGLGRAARWALRHLLVTVDKIACVSAATAEAVVELGVPRGHVVVASPFIGEGLAGGARDARRRKNGEVLVSVMAAEPPALYGLDLVRDAFPSVVSARPHARLVVFGTGGADHALAEELRARGFGDRVEAVGELAHDSVLALLRASDVFLRPTRADGDSMAVREALAVGCRVVASDAAVRPPGTVVFPAGDAARFAASVDRALAEPRHAASGDDGLATMVSLYRALGWQPRSVISSL